MIMSRHIHRRHVGAITKGVDMSAILAGDSTGYNVRQGSRILADRFAALSVCAGCGDTVAPSGKCLNVGDCRRADRQASRSSLARGTAASARPAAWTLGGRVD